MLFPMKFSLFILAVLLPIFCPAIRAADEAGVMPIWMFSQKAPTYGYEGWQDLASIGEKSGEGWTISGSAKGGFGIFFPELLDLESAAKFRVRLRVNDGNTEGKLMFKFHAADGKQAIWYVSLSQLDIGKDADVELDMAKPDEVADGGKPDMGIIRQIQVQGTFNPEKRVNVTFVSWDARQQP